MVADKGFFEVYGIGPCYASVCTDLSDAEATDRLNGKHPTLISSKWAISTDETFKGGEPNPCPCEKGNGRRHILFTC